MEAYTASHSKNNRGAKHECEFQLNPCINLWIIAFGVILEFYQPVSLQVARAGLDCLMLCHSIQQYIFYWMYIASMAYQNLCWDLLYP